MKSEDEKQDRDKSPLTGQQFSCEMCGKSISLGSFAKFIYSLFYLDMTQ